MKGIAGRGLSFNDFESHHYLDEIPIETTNSYHQEDFIYLSPPNVELVPRTKITNKWE